MLVKIFIFIPTPPETRSETDFVEGFKVYLSAGNIISPPNSMTGLVDMLRFAKEVTGGREVYS